MLHRFLQHFQGTTFSHHMRVTGNARHSSQNQTPNLTILRNCQLCKGSGQEVSFQKVWNISLVLYISCQMWTHHSIGTKPFSEKDRCQEPKLFLIEIIVCTTIPKNNQNITFYEHMGVSLKWWYPPNHPKMIIFSRENPMVCWVPPF